jgi:hypothetical protein
MMAGVAQHMTMLLLRGRLLTTKRRRATRRRRSEEEEPVPDVVKFDTVLGAIVIRGVSFL